MDLSLEMDQAATALEACSKEWLDVLLERQSITQQREIKRQITGTIHVHEDYMIALIERIRSNYIWPACAGPDQSCPLQVIPTASVERQMRRMGMRSTAVTLTSRADPSQTSAGPFASRT